MTDSKESGGIAALKERITSAYYKRRNKRALEHARSPISAKATRGRTTATSGVRREPGMGRGTHRPRSRKAAMIGAAAAAIAVIALLFLGPGSIGTWFNQRSQTAALEAKISALEDANETLSRRAEDLKDPQTIEAIARSNYGMVPKGAKAYAIMPSAEADDRLGGTWPFVNLTGTDPKPTSTTAP